MTQPHLIHVRRAAAVLACWACAGFVYAQSDEDDAPPAPPGQVVSDVEPLPAEHRDSHGAVVLHGAPVRAQKADQKPPGKAQPQRVGRNAATVIERSRDWKDVREADAASDVPSGEASGAGAAPR